MNKKMLQIIKNPLFALTFLHVAASNAFAAGGDMPWQTPLENIMNSVSGPVAKSIGVIAIVVTGLGLAFGEGGGGMKKMLWVVFGLSIAFAATSFFLDFFGFSAGALI